ncbi:MAG TPA: GntR family transcriptional regulator [Rubrobacteraceae bacterium]|nr:GntR family transcriptional regulator [Rubrobacteraceae bacterium]
MTKDPLYVRVEKRIEDLLVRGRYRVGERIPPESELVKSLGVSRVTVRAGLARLVERGLLERRQGSGTFLARFPEEGRPRAGGIGFKLGSAQADLGSLETYTVLAERMGLELSSRDLRIERIGADSEQAEALEVPEGSGLVRVSRVLLADGDPAAWMVDVVPEGIISVDRVRERFRPDAMLLDVLVSEGVPVGFSEVLIEAEMVLPEDWTAEALELESPSAALSLTETMYLETAHPADGRPVQWSRNLFLPGRLKLHIVRELAEQRDPSLVFRLPSNR